MAEVDWYRPIFSVNDIVALLGFVSEQTAVDPAAGLEGAKNIKSMRPPPAAIIFTICNVVAAM